MPLKTDPRDWERFFDKPPRRSGPLRSIIIAGLIGLILVAAIGATPFLLDQIERNRVVTSQTQIALQTREARQALTASAISGATPAPSPTLLPPPLPSPTPTPEPIIGRARVINGGNIRREPQVSADTVIGQVCVDDRVELLREQTLADGSRWYWLRVVETAADCVPQRVPAGTQGWVSAILLSAPEP